MTALQPSLSFNQWLVGARQRAHQPARQPRQALRVAGQVVGSVAAGVLSQISLQRLWDKRYQLSNGERMSVLPSPATARLAFAHADWSGYSVFEEAFTRGHAAGLAVRW